MIKNKTIIITGLILLAIDLLSYYKEIQLYFTKLGIYLLFISFALIIYGLNKEGILRK